MKPAEAEVPSTATNHERSIHLRPPLVSTSRYNPPPSPYQPADCAALIAKAVRRFNPRAMSYDSAEAGIIHYKPHILPNLMRGSRAACQDTRCDSEAAS